MSCSLPVSCDQHGMEWNINFWPGCVTRRLCRCTGGKHFCSRRLSMVCLLMANRANARAIFSVVSLCKTFATAPQSKDACSFGASTNVKERRDCDTDARVGGAASYACAQETPQGGRTMPKKSGHSRMCPLFRQVNAGSSHSRGRNRHCHGRKGTCVRQASKVGR